MLKTPEELRLELGQAIRFRRIARGWSQEEAAKRAGMGISTWKRMETHGPSLVENMINAAFALRCEDGISQLFPAPAAANLDELLQRQAATVSKPRQRAPRQRAPRRRSTP
jgi:transcriptional regulator with XRE-family HTH domain